MMLICSALAHAQTASIPRTLPALYFDVSSVDQGWQPSTVTSIVQSHDGYLWLGTYNGLLRYDGVRFSLFDSANAPGLKNSRITSLFEDSEDVLWIGHETGELTRFANGRFEQVRLESNWPGGAIEAITADERRKLWLVNANGILFRLTDSLLTSFPGAGSSTLRILVTRSSSGEVWLTANGQVARLQRGNPAPFHFKGSADTDYYQAVLTAREGGLWSVVNGSLKKFQDGGWHIEMSNFPGAQSPVSAILETRSGTLLVGTLNDGLFMLVPGAPALHFSRTNGLSHDWVRCLCEDHEGNVWVGTGAGLDTLRARKVKMLNPPDQWQGRSVLSVATQSDGSAWIGTEGAGLYHLAGETWTSFKQEHGLSNLFVWSVLSTRRGDLLVGTWGGGLFLKNGGRFEPQGELNGLGAAVTSLFESSAGDIWVGTPEGLCRFAEGKLVHVGDKDKLVLPDVRAITEDAEGTIWFGMVGGGLGSYKDGHLEQYRKQNGASSDFVQCLLAEPDGTLWLGTSDNGLIRFRQKKFTSLSEQQGLPDRSISHLVDDHRGNLWMGSHSGILRASKADLIRCAEGQSRSIRCFNYGKAEGLVSLTCSGGFQPGACQTASGLLWFPTTKGVAIVDPVNVTTNAVEPPVVIERLIVDGAPLNPDSALRTAESALVKVPPGKKRFEIHYTGLSFAAPDKVLFRHKLEGLEPDWIEPTTKRVAEYSYLRPGSYVFHVRACNNDGIWNETGAALAFTVLPWFWQTWWFEGAALLAGAGVVGGTVRSVTRRRIRARLDQLERQQALERERARIARDIHDDLGASLTRISMLSQTVRSELGTETQAAAEVDQIYGTACELTRAMDEIVWAVNPKHDTLDSLVTYLGRFAQNFLSAATIRCRLDVPLNLPAWALTAEIRHNTFLAFKEALHNIVKHARASEVRISLELLPQGFTLIVADNGSGFDSNAVRSNSLGLAEGTRVATGNGLSNMRKRLEEVGGRCECESAPGEGTRIKFVIRINHEAHRPFPSPLVRRHQN